MKKILFVTLALAVGMTGFAQKNQPVKAEKGKFGVANIYKKAYKGFGEAPIMNFAPTQAAPSNPTRDPEFPEDCQTIKVPRTSIRLLTAGRNLRRSWTDRRVK